MENVPVITMSARTIPPEIEERYNLWYNTAYGPIYLKTPGIKGIDRYEIIKKNRALPGEINLYHGESFESFKKVYSNPKSDRNAAAHDAVTSFNEITRFWLNIYELMGSFRESTQGNVESTIVEGAPVIHIQGYKIVEPASAKFESWFNKWASQVYIPLLLKIPGLKACNFFTLVDFKDPGYTGVRFVESDMPRYISIFYLEKTESLEDFYQSTELAAFSGSLELGFPDSLKTLWNADYQLFASHRP